MDLNCHRKGWINGQQLEQSRNSSQQVAKNRKDQDEMEKRIHPNGQKEEETEELNQSNRTSKKITRDLLITHNSINTSRKSQKIARIRKQSSLTASAKLYGSLSRTNCLIQ